MFATVMLLLSNTVAGNFRRSVLLLLLTLAFAGMGTAQNPQAPEVLEAGKPIERALASGETHSYTIQLKAGQFVRLIVNQQSIDALVFLYGPDVKQLVRLDDSFGGQTEDLSWIGETSGSYVLKVKAAYKKSASGRYEVKIEELRTATQRDRDHVAVVKAFETALSLSFKDEPEAKRSAIQKFEETFALAKASDFGLMQTRSLHYVASGYDDLNDAQKALDYFSQALELERAIGDRFLQPFTLSRMGEILKTAGDVRKALACYDEALAISHATNDRATESFVLLPRSILYNSIGENQKALEDALKAQTLARDTGNRGFEARAYHILGMVHDELGDQQKALEFFLQSLAIKREENLRSGQPYTLNRIGGIYFDLDQNEKAAEFFRQALELEQESGDRQAEAMTLNNLAFIYEDEGDSRKALELREKSLALSREVGDRVNEAIALGNIGELYLQLNDQQKALESGKQSLTIARAIGARVEQCEALYLIAKAEDSLGNLNDARRDIEAVLSIVESLRLSIGGDELRSSYFASVQDYYEFYIGLLMRLHEKQPHAGYNGLALQVSERARARSLLDTLAEAGADIREGVEPKLLERERALQKQMNSAAQEQTSLLSGKHTEAQAKAIAEQIETLTTNYRQVEAEIRQSSPRYASLTQPQPLSLKEIQAQVVDANTVLLEYSLGDERSYLWAVTPDSITSYELSSRDDIEKAARELYDLLSVPEHWFSGDSLAALRSDKKIPKTNSADLKSKAGVRQQSKFAAPEVAIRLSEMLIAPVADRIAGKRLLVVADGALQYLPFGALPIVHGKSGGRTNYRPLILEHEIVSLPSASTLAVLRHELKDRKPAARTVAVLADPVFERSDERVAPKSQRSTVAPPETKSSNHREALDKASRDTDLRGAVSGIPRLPGTREEARQILLLTSSAQSKGSFDFSASRQMATSDELSHYRYVHFATHGFLDSVHPELSGIVLSLIDENGNSQDGFLRAHEVFNLRLSAELVVLSACQTGLGKEVKGEGLIGLTRGFMYAGAPRVVVSLWSVDDQSTAELMARFYRGMLKDKLRPAAALRAAQVSLMKEKTWKSPFYWSAFTLQGEWR